MVFGVTYPTHHEAVIVANVQVRDIQSPSFTAMEQSWEATGAAHLVAHI